MKKRSPRDQNVSVHFGRESWADCHSARRTRLTIRRRSENWTQIAIEKRRICVAAQKRRAPRQKGEIRPHGPLFLGARGRVLFEKAHEETSATASARPDRQLSGVQAS